MMVTIREHANVLIYPIHTLPVTEEKSRFVVNGCPSLALPTHLQKIDAPRGGTQLERVSTSLHQ